MIGIVVEKQKSDNLSSLVLSRATRDNSPNSHRKSEGKTVEEVLKYINVLQKREGGLSQIFDGYI